MNRLVLVMMMVVIGGCSTQKYGGFVGSDYATFSLSSSQNNLPAVSIKYGCDEYSIGREYVEKRKYIEKTKTVNRMPSGVPVAFNVLYSNIPIRTKTLVNTGGNFNQRLEYVDQFDFGSCESMVSFIPKHGVHYEVYSAIQQNLCRVRVVEVATNAESGNREYTRINHVDIDTCKKS